MLKLTNLHTHNVDSVILTAGVALCKSDSLESAYYHHRRV